jgi:hypothetical protein
VKFIQVCTKSFVTPSFDLVLKSQVSEIDEATRKALMRRELLLGTQIASLVGSSEIANFLEYENDEIADFRRSGIKSVAG